jgi:hypothetical protein
MSLPPKNFPQFSFRKKTIQKNVCFQGDIVGRRFVNYRYVSWAYMVKARKESRKASLSSLPDDVRPPKKQDSLIPLGFFAV